MFRSVLVVLAGLVAGMLVVTAIESLIPMVFSGLPRIEPNDYAAAVAAKARLPAGVFAMLMIGWACGSLAAGVVVGRLAAHWSLGAPRVHALVVGALQMAGAIVNFVMLPHPNWVIAGGLVVFMPMVLLGVKLGRPREL